MSKMRGFRRFFHSCSMKISCAKIHLKVTLSPRYVLYYTTEIAKSQEQNRTDVLFRHFAQNTPVIFG